MPTKKTPETAKRIVAMLKKGAFRKTAFLAAGIGHSTFAEWLNEDAEFAQQVEAAEEFAIGQAVDRVLAAARGGQKRTKVTRKVNAEGKVIEETVETSKAEPNPSMDKYYLSIKDPKRFGSKLDVTTDGEKLPAATILVGLKDLDEAEIDRRIAEAEGRKAP